MQIKKGVSGALKEKAVLKSIVELSPYRTFREVELRVKLSQNDAPLVALFEADGGAWVNRVTENIVQYIQGLVADIPVIA